MPVGAAGIQMDLGSAIMMNPSLHSDSRATSRDLNRIVVRNFGLFAGL
jgi:hypothetical protein